jgi:hypothetical protein
MSDIFIPFGGGGSIKTPDGKEYVANVVPVIEETAYGPGSLPDVIRTKSTANLYMCHPFAAQNSFKDGDYYYFVSPSSSGGKAFVSKWTVSPLECIAVLELTGSGSLHIYAWANACIGEDYFYIQTYVATTMTDICLYKIQKSTMTVSGTLANYKATSISSGGPWVIGDYLYMIGDKAAGQILKIAKSNLSVQTFTVGAVVTCTTFSVTGEDSSANLVIGVMDNTQTIKTVTFHVYSSALSLVGTYTFESPSAVNLNYIMRDLNIPGFVSYGPVVIFDIRSIPITANWMPVTNNYSANSYSYTRGTETTKVYCLGFIYPAFDTGDQNKIRFFAELDLINNSYEIIALRKNIILTHAYFMPGFMSKQEITSALGGAGLPIIGSSSGAANQFGRAGFKSRAESYSFYTEKL